jgi:hypothetical protein
VTIAPTVKPAPTTILGNEVESFAQYEAFEAIELRYHLRAIRIWALRLRKLRNRVLRVSAVHYHVYGAEDLERQELIEELADRFAAD